jgi:hypothetical protein
MVFAVAGRRIDAPDTDTPRFPLRNAGLVRQRIRALLEARRPCAVVSSAACGADLIVLEQASALGIHYRVILPSDPDHFRATSVTDRPGDWGPLYDRLMHDIASSEDLVLLPDSAKEVAAYGAVNRLILDEAENLAKSGNQRAIAVLVWNGQPRVGDDFTKLFGDEAKQRGMKVLTVSTID